MTDSNIYCQGNLVILNDDGSEEYKGGVYFRDTTGKEYCSMQLKYNSGSYDTILFDCKDLQVNGLGIQAYNNDFREMTLANELTGYGLWTIGIQAWQYNQEWAPISTFWTAPSTPGDWVTVIDT